MQAQSAGSRGTAGEGGGPFDETPWSPPVATDVADVALCDKASEDSHICSTHRLALVSSIPQMQTIAHRFPEEHA